MMRTVTKLMVCQLFLLIICIHGIPAHSDRILLNDVKVLTLHHGQMTNARRTSAVPQLKCVGGSAGCAFKPQTVQCYNRGSDGYDVQWECKTDMDNAYRFGKLQVSCEGFDYPEDPYILRGSCGLEYNLDLTEEGWERKNAGNKGSNHEYGYNSNPQYHYQESYSKQASSVFSDLFYLAIIAGIIYIIYRTCIASGGVPADQPPPYDATFRPHDGARPSAPPYGFRSEYMPNDGASCSSGTTYTGGQTHTAPGTGTGGGFWTGAFTGGLMGYLLGNRNNTYYGYQRPNTGWWGNTGWGTGWGTGGGNSGWGTGGGWGSSARTFTTTTSSTPKSTGTRTASGFGGTTRR